MSPPRNIIIRLSTLKKREKNPKLNCEFMSANFFLFLTLSNLTLDSIYKPRPTTTRIKIAASALMMLLLCVTVFLIHSYRLALAASQPPSFIYFSPPFVHPEESKQSKKFLCLEAICAPREKKPFNLELSFIWWSGTHFGSRWIDEREWSPMKYFTCNFYVKSETWWENFSPLWK